MKLPKSILKNKIESKYSKGSEEESYRRSAMRSLKPMESKSKTLLKMSYDPKYRTEKRAEKNYNAQPETMESTTKTLHGNDLRESLYIRVNYETEKAARLKEDVNKGKIIMKLFGNKKRKSTENQETSHARVAFTKDYDVKVPKRSSRKPSDWDVKVP